MPRKHDSIGRRNADLVRRIQQGDDQAKERLLDVNKRLIYHIAQKHLPIAGCLTLEDLAQEGRLGLLHAAELFDLERGTQFSTYASPWVRQAILRAIETTGHPIRWPSQIVQAYWRACRVADDTEEFAGYARVCASLDDVCGEEERSTIADFVRSPEDEIGDTLNRVWMESLLEGLKPKERRVVTMRLGLDGRGTHLLSEVGNTLGYTRERIRQVEKKALERLAVVMGVEGYA